MWRSEKSKPGKLPSSTLLLTHAKADRAPATSLFHDATKKWMPVVRKPVEVEEFEMPATAGGDKNLPAFLRHRPMSKAGKLFFKTKVATRNVKK